MMVLFDFIFIRYEQKNLILNFYVFNFNKKIIFLIIIGKYKWYYSFLICKSQNGIITLSNMLIKNGLNQFHLFRVINLICLISNQFILMFLNSKKFSFFFIFLNFIQKMFICKVILKSLFFFSFNEYFFSLICFFFLFIIEKNF